MLLHRCSGSRNLWRQMFAVLNLIQVVRSRSWLFMEKRWGRLSISQRTGSYPCSALAPVQAPRNVVAGPLPPSHEVQMSGWELRRNSVSWGAVNPWAWHTEDTAGAFSRSLENCQWEHREVDKDMITCLVFAYTMWDSGYNLKFLTCLSIGSKQPRLSYGHYQCNLFEYYMG